MSSDEGMSSFVISDDEILPPSNSKNPSKKKVRTADEEEKSKPGPVKGTVKRKYVRRSQIRQATAPQANSNIANAWDLVRKTYEEGLAVIIIIPQSSEHTVPVSNK